MSNLPDHLKPPLVDLLLAVADDKLFLGHRNAEWTGLGPILEEDIAFSALAQDDIAHAAALYQLVAELTGDDADRIAYGRPPQEYRCAAIVELADEFDWSVALVRQFFCDHFEKLRLARLAHSAFEPLRALAAKMAREEALSIGHADQWIVRLAHANDEARGRVQAALQRVAPLTPTLFEPTERQAELEAAALYPPLERPMFETWADMVANVLEAAGLPTTLPRPDPATAGGRRGRHTAEFGPLLDELSEVWRVEPQARW